MNGSQQRLSFIDTSNTASRTHTRNDSLVSPSSSANFTIAPNPHNAEASSSPIVKYDELHGIDYADGASTTRTISTPHMTFSSGRTTLFHPHISASPTLASQTLSHSNPPPSLHPPGPPHTATSPYSSSFFDKDEAMQKARKMYMGIYAKGLLAVVVTIFIVFPLYWGSLWLIPAHAMKGWIVNFDGGPIGQRVAQDLSAFSGRPINWQEVPSSRFPNGPSDLIDAVKDNRAWVAVSINPGSSDRYQNSLQNPDPAYNGSAVVTAYGIEGRNENVFRVLIRPYIYNTLGPICQNYTAFLAAQLVSSNASRSAADLVSLMSLSPQTVTLPVGYTLVNLIPFAQPVASAVVFVGLIYLLILSFFIVAIAYNARQVSGINDLLSLRSLIVVRLVSSALGYFLLSFFYSLLNVAFKLNLSRKYGSVGFVIFWMLNWIGMCSVGLALESLITLLSPKWVPFFMIAWIIVNVSVCVFPIDILPRFYRYGYAVPFYNISSSVRSITFGTKNTLGLNFGVLFAWVLISCLTLPLIQWFVRRKEINADLKAAADAGRGQAQDGQGHGAGDVGRQEQEKRTRKYSSASASSTPEMKAQGRVPRGHGNGGLGGDQEKQGGR